METRSTYNLQRPYFLQGPSCSKPPQTVSSARDPAQDTGRHSQFQQWLINYPLVLGNLPLLSSLCLRQFALVFTENLQMTYFFNL